MKPTRPASVSLLIRILDQKQTLDEALAQDELFDRLEGSDRGFARIIVSETLRQLGQIDALLSRFVTGRPFDELDAEVKHILRIGAAQICLLQTPLHAAVSETVDAARAFEASRRAGGLINAVLRKITPKSLSEMDLPARSAWPNSFARLLETELGEEVAESVAAAMMQTPPLDLTMKSDAEVWADRLGGARIGPQTVRLGSGVVDSLPGYDAGDWWVQDVAATLPVHLLAPSRGERILDLCAAPGGKTLQIAASGAHTTAVDRSAKRLRLVSANLDRTGLEAQTFAADATKWESMVRYDGVLIDAPCSALGTLRRHPEGPWIKSISDLARFPTIQARLLESAAQRVKKGGRMVYCVCTPMPREGKAIVDGFLKAHPDWVREDVAAEEAGDFASAITPEGDLLTLPALFAERGGCDIFYIARLRQRAG